MRYDFYCKQFIQRESKSDLEELGESLEKFQGYLCQWMDEKGFFQVLVKGVAVGKTQSDYICILVLA